MIHKILRKIKSLKEASMRLLYGGEIGTQNGVLPKPNAGTHPDYRSKVVEDLVSCEVSALYEDDTFDLDAIFQGMYSEFFSDVQYVLSAS